MPARTVIVSGIQPTGELHIGNYFGAITNWARFQDDCRCFYMIVDLHAMTMPYNPSHLLHNTEQMVIDLLACGIEPSKSTLFIQSLVPEHTELCWILSCVCAFGDLTRQTQFREKSEQAGSDPSGRFISAGLFTYPVLQTADILAYRAGQVPVGRDQVQHLELARDIARRFNRQFGDYFPEPQVLQTETPKIMSLTDPDRKMSKQHGPRHYIGLFEEEESIRAKVRGAVTDSGMLPPGMEMSAGVANLFSILNACGKADEAATLLREYEAGNRQYSRLKEAVAEALVRFVNPLRVRRTELMQDREAAMVKVRQMSEQAREVARETVKGVRALVGLPARD